MEEVLRHQLDEKEYTFQKLEMKVVDLRKKDKKYDAYVKFNNSSVILDEILDFQRSPFDKFGLGYNKEAEKPEVCTWTPKTYEARPSFSKGESKVVSHVPTQDNKDFRRSEKHQEVGSTP